MSSLRLQFRDKNVNVFKADAILAKDNGNPEIFAPRSFSTAAQALKLRQCVTLRISPVLLVMKNSVCTRRFWLKMTPNKFAPLREEPGNAKRICIRNVGLEY